MTFRLLNENDFEKGFPHILQNLTKTGDWTIKEFLTHFMLLQNKPQKTYVLEENNQIIATGTILWEAKWIHHGASVAHIEDIVVHPLYQGKGIGKKLMTFLIQKCQENKKTYKIILDASDANIEFYEKCGFTKKENQMVIYLSN